MTLHAGSSELTQTAHDAQRSNAVNERTKPTSQTAPISEHTGPTRTAAPAPEGRPLQPQAQSNESAPAREAPLSVRSFTLALPSDNNFLGAPLPAADPDRYRVWAQKARIWVGKSSLDDAIFLDDERLILARSEAEAGVRLYEKSSHKLRAQYFAGLEHSSSATLLPWSAHGTWFLVGSGGGLQLYDAHSGALVSTLSTNPVDGMRWSPDGTVLVVRTTPAADQPSVLSFYRKQGAQQLQELGKIPLFGRVEGWDLSADNRLLAVSLYPQPFVVVFDLHAGQIVAQVPAQNFAGNVSISPDGRWLAVGGQGLLLVDLANPARRAFYSYYANNIDSVRFSPSGDALVTSSYDGRIRIFAYDAAGPTLRLIKTLSHDGQANVYSIQFAADGNNLLSSSGDQTLRIFGAAPNAHAATRVSQERFRSLDDWKRSLPANVMTIVAPPQPSMRDGHYYPPQLDAPPRSAKIRPGTYACHISTMYKLRDCTVRQAPSGHMLLEFQSDNLLSLTGVLYDDGPVVRYEAWLTEPSTIVGCDGCELQPLHGILRGAGGRYKGLLTFRNYYDPLVPPPLPDANAVSEDTDDRFELILNYKGPLP